MFHLENSNRQYAALFQVIYRKLLASVESGIGDYKFIETVHANRSDDLEIWFKAIGLLALCFYHLSSACSRGSSNTRY